MKTKAITTLLVNGHECNRRVCINALASSIFLFDLDADDFTDRGIVFDKIDEVIRVLGPNLHSMNFARDTDRFLANVTLAKFFPHFV